MFFVDNNFLACILLLLLHTTKLTTNEMKTLYKNPLSSLLLLVVSLTTWSCEEVDFVLSNFPSKVEGSWTFERVKFRRSWAIDGNDITNEYRNMTFNFYSDGEMSLEYADNSGRINIDYGFWSVEKEYDCNGATNCDEQRFLHIDINNAGNGLFDYNTWEITHLGTEKMKAKEEFSFGTYKYKLRQIY